MRQFLVFLLYGFEQRVACIITQKTVITAHMFVQSYATKTLSASVNDLKARKKEYFRVRHLIFERFESFKNNFVN